MPSTTSPNASFELMATGEDIGTWGTKTNSNWSISDLNRGGRLNIDVSGNSNITVSTTQARNVYHLITGTLTGSINYDLPEKGGFFFLNNSTSGTFTITARCVGGTGLIIPQGTSVSVFVNPDTLEATAANDFIPGATTVFIGEATGGSANTQTITLMTPGFTLTAGNSIVCFAGFTSTAAVTLNVNGLGATSIYIQSAGSTIAAGANSIVVGQPLLLVYDGTHLVLTNPAPTIEITMGLTPTPPVGKLLINGDSVGSTTSGATFAAIIYQTVYAYWWNNVLDADAPVAGGRGANAAADFAANKALTMPDWANRSPYGVGTLNNAGKTGGAATVASSGTISTTVNGHTLTSAEIPSVSVTISPTIGTYNVDFIGSSSPGVRPFVSGDTLISGTTAGGGGSHDHPATSAYTGSTTSVLHPVAAIYYYINY